MDLAFEVVQKCLCIYGHESFPDVRYFPTLVAAKSFVESDLSILFLWTAAGDVGYREEFWCKEGRVVVIAIMLVLA